MIQFGGRRAGGEVASLSAAQLDLNQRVIGCGIGVHRELGPGLAEALYEEAMAIELRRVGIGFVRQVEVPVRYRGEVIGTHRLDLLVDDSLIVELKAVEALALVHRAQVASYLKLTGKPVGLLMNFNAPVLSHAVERFVNMQAPRTRPSREPMANRTLHHIGKPDTPDHSHNPTD
ncbi:MAG: GxxExxY protein [Phycisphaerales bacterium]|nr:GxxExxY protein [Phycisphaerales bacterium]